MKCVYEDENGYCSIYIDEIQIYGRCNPIQKKYCIYFKEKSHCYRATNNMIYNNKKYKRGQFIPKQKSL